MEQKQGSVKAEDSQLVAFPATFTSHHGFAVLWVAVGSQARCVKQPPPKCLPSSTPSRLECAHLSFWLWFEPSWAQWADCTRCHCSASVTVAAIGFWVREPEKMSQWKPQEWERPLRVKSFGRSYWKKNCFPWCHNNQKHPRLYRGRRLMLPHSQRWISSLTILLFSTCRFTGSTYKALDLMRSFQKSQKEL